MDDFLNEAGTAEVMSSKKENPFKRVVEWKAGKLATRNLKPELAKQVAEANLPTCGFKWFVRDDAGKRNEFERENFVFIPLFTMAKVSVYIPGANGEPDINYWSNLVFDSRIEDFAVWKTGEGKEPYLEGKWADIKGKLPDRAWTNTIACWSPQNDEIFELTVGGVLGKAIEKAVRESNSGLRDFSFFSLAGGKGFIGFALKGIEIKPVKDGGDDGFWPVLRCGALTKAEYITQAEQAKQVVSDWHKSELLRQAEYAQKKKGEQVSRPAASPHDEEPPEPTPWFEQPSKPTTPATPFPTEEPLADGLTDEERDDLPF